MNNELNNELNNEGIEIDLGEIFQLLLKKAWLIILCLLIGAQLAFGYTKLFVTPQYQATNMLYIFSNSSGLTLQLSSQLTVDFTTMATSRTVVERVIDNLELNTSYEALVSTIQVVNPSSTQILKISATNSDPVLARDIANAMADATAERIAEVMLTDKPNIIDAAVIPKSPISPNTTRNVEVGGLLGAFIAVAFIVIRKMLDDTVVNEDDVSKYLGLNTLAVIPVNKGRVRSDKRVEKSAGRKSA